MAKSKNNFLTLEDIEKKGIDLAAFRLLVLESNYRTEAHLSWDNLEAASNRLKHWQAVADLRWQVKQSASLDEAVMKAPLQENLDTPKLLSVIDHYLDEIERKNTQPDVRTLKSIDELLGIDLIKDDIATEFKVLLQSRQEAREAGDYELADKIRDELGSQGLGIKDLSDKQIWYRL